MKLFDVYPLNDIAITKAMGSYVWDDKGEKYLDLYGGHAVISIGLWACSNRSNSDVLFAPA